MSQDVAMSCQRCGHIRRAVESEKKCAGCGLEPARWASAPIEDEDDQATVSTAAIEPPVPYTDAPRAPDPAELFATAPPGAEGSEANPELKIRR